jgi:hypothetical protein
MLSGMASVFMPVAKLYFYKDLTLTMLGQIKQDYLSKDREGHQNCPASFSWT